MAHMQPVRAKVPRRRELRARVGVLENVRGGGRRRTGLGAAMSQLGAGYTECRAIRGRVVRERGRAVYEAAPWRIMNETFSSRRAILRAHIVL